MPNECFSRKVRDNLKNHWYPRQWSSFSYKKILSSPDTVNEDWWDQISQSERDSINRGLVDLNKGNVYSHDQIKKVCKLD